MQVKIKSSNFAASEFFDSLKQALFSKNSDAAGRVKIYFSFNAFLAGWPGRLSLTEYPENNQERRHSRGNDM